MHHVNLSTSLRFKHVLSRPYVCKNQRLAWKASSIFRVQHSFLQAHPAESLAVSDGRRDGGGRGHRGGGRGGRGPRIEEGSNGTDRAAGKAASAAAADLPFPVIIARRLFTAESAIVSYSSAEP